MIEQFGESHPFTRSSVFAEYLDSDSVIPLILIERLMANPPQPTHQGGVCAFCDFGGPAAECVLAIRRGNAVEIAGVWRGRSTMESVGRFTQLFKAHSLEPNQIHGDADRMGIVFCDAFAEQGWSINRFHGGKAAWNSGAYVNAISELWYEARRKTERAEIVLPNDQTLIGQLTSRRGYVNSKGSCASNRKRICAAAEYDRQTERTPLSGHCAKASAVSFCALDHLMNGFNKVILAGNLTRDPGAAVRPSPKAESRSTDNGPGREKNQDVTFVDWTVFGDTAALVAEHTRKGMAILFEGRLNLEQWEGRDGKRQKLGVLVERGLSCLTVRLVTATEISDRPKATHQNEPNQIESRHWRIWRESADDTL